MKIKYEYICMVMNVWVYSDGEKVLVVKIIKVYFELGMMFLELYDDSYSEVLVCNIQKIFCWVEKDIFDVVEKIQVLLLVIEKVMLFLLVVRMCSYSLVYFWELVEMWE